MVKKRGCILFATDFSAASRGAWQEAVSMVKGRRSTLLIAHVLHSAIPFSPEGLPLPRTADELEAAVQRESIKALENLLKKTRRAGVRATGLLLRGRPEDAIARAAKKHGSDLVIVGTHGRTGLPRLLLGSVAARIIAASPCPVLAVPRRRASSSAR
jgi:nucleotide-binding universal stress UspA family protein